MENKPSKHILIALAIFLSIFFSWMLISQAGLDILDGPVGEEGKKVVAVYFNNAVNTSADEIGNYWLDEGASEPVSEIPDFSVVELNILPKTQFDGDAIFVGNSSNQGTVNGNAVFIGDSSENLGVVTGTRTREYNQAIETSRDFTGSDAPWIVLANNVEVNVVNAVYNNSTTFTRMSGGSFVSNLAISSATITGNSLVLTYNSGLSSDSVPATSDYQVLINNESISVSSLAIGSNFITLTLNSSVNSGDVVTISYIPGENQLLNSQGLNAMSLENLEVEVQAIEEEVPDDEDLPIDEENNDSDMDINMGGNNNSNQNVSLDARSSGGSLPVQFLSQQKVTQKTEIKKQETTVSTKISKDKTVETIKNEDSLEVSKKTTTTSSPLEKKEEAKINPTFLQTAPALTDLEVKQVEKLQGKVLLSVEDKGRMWYVAPTKVDRYEVSQENALNLFRETSLGITNKDLEKIPQAGTTTSIPPIAKRLTGYFLLQVENRGQTWYVDSLGYRHKVNIDNIVEVTKESAIGITEKDLSVVPIK